MWVAGCGWMWRGCCFVLYCGCLYDVGGMKAGEGVRRRKKVEESGGKRIGYVGTGLRSFGLGCQCRYV